MLFIALASFAAAIPTIASTCPSLTPRTAPTSVKDVRIDDIKVIAALGDSITAGYSAKPKKNPNGAVGLGDLIEYRGVSFAIGGDSGADTLGNYVAQFSPNLIGRSIGQHFIATGHTANADKLNAAIVGAKSGDLVSQANWLVGQLKGNSQINMNKDFKLLTLLIGANDVCQSCDTAVDPDVWISNVRKAISVLEANVPRLIVNIPQLFKVTELYNLTATSAYCDKRRSSPLTAECNCAFLEGTNGIVKRTAMNQLTDELNKRILAIRNDYLTKNSDNFMVTSDPSVGQFSLAANGISFLSDTDCFHPSVVAHGQVAKAMWSNLFVPYEQKTTPITARTSYTCPSSDSRIRF